MPWALQDPNALFRNGCDWGTDITMESVRKFPADLDKNESPSQEDGVKLKACCFSKAG